MTKREICERLINIHNRLFHEYAMADGMEDIDVEEIGKDIGYLILDLAAPEEEPKPEAPKAEEAHPGIIVDQSGKNPPRCLKCGRDAEVVHYMGDEWVLCPKCGCAYRIKSGKDEK
jgi:hypothetical protein